MRRKPLWIGGSGARFRTATRKARAQMGRVAYAAMKRSLDVALSLGLMIAAAPVLALVAALIKLEDGGPVLYWQLRVGKHGRTFRFPKFRSMVLDAEAKLVVIRALNQHGDGVTFKMKNDPRVTCIGRFLRRFSLDELPQLWCVFRGQMSLVGPRPALPREVERYSIAERRRLDVVPGLTCIWQVSGRSNLPFPVQCQLDSEYIERQSIGTDLAILAATAPAVVSGKGAY